MPLYEYDCEACGERFEVIRKFSDPELEACARCGKGPVRRLMSSPAIQFKGSGWYITDYAQKDKSGGQTSTPTAVGDEKAAPAASDSGAKTEAPAPTTKPASSDS